MFRRFIPFVLTATAVAAAPALAVAPPGVPVVPPIVTGPLAPAAAQPSGAAPLIGTFELTAGTCADDVAGTYFRMVQPGGSGGGPFVSNSDSPCRDKSYTALEPGSDRGLVTGSYQPQPDPAFDATGNGRASRITKPQRFYGVDFASATNATDPQTSVKVPAPRIEHDGAGRLTGDVRAFAASWNTQHFNQGAPKPDGSTPGVTSGPTGTYDAATGRFVLEWASQIVGGPFNNFTGVWHLEGVFRSGAGSARPAAGAAPPPASSGSAAAPASDAEGSAATRAPGATGGAGGAGALADTGPSFPRWIGALCLALGFAGLYGRRRIGEAGGG